MSRGDRHVPGVGILGAGCPVGVASYYSARRASGVDGDQDESEADVSGQLREDRELQLEGEMLDHTSGGNLGKIKSM